MLRGRTARHPLGIEQRKGPRRLAIEAEERDDAAAVRDEAGARSREELVSLVDEESEEGWIDGLGWSPVGWR